MDDRHVEVGRFALREDTRGRQAAKPVVAPKAEAVFAVSGGENEAVAALVPEPRKGAVDGPGGRPEG